MTPRRLIFKSLCYYWKPYLAAVLGLAVSTAVVTGALVIADSVKSTLRQNALSRLGSIRSALVAPRFIPVSRDPNATPAILLKGSAMMDESVASVTDVSVVGIDTWFGKAFGAPMHLPGNGECVLNRRLADELGVKEGQDVLVSVPLLSQAPVSSLFGRRSVSDMRSLLRVSVARILPDKGIGSFSLDPSPRPRYNVYLNLNWLSGQLGEAGKCNAFLVSSTESSSFGAKAEDCGLIANGPMLHYDRLAFPPGLLSSVEKANPKVDAGAVYLASRFTGLGGRSSSYSVVGSRSSLGLAQNDIVLTAWLAQDLGASAGSEIGIEWMEAQPDGSYQTRSAKCRVKSVLPDGAIDPPWTSEFEGITNATTLEQWDPPFPFDPKRITPRDELYWDRYKAAPKAWISQALMDRMWGSPTVTTLSDAENLNLKDLAKACGLAYQPVRQQALEAAEGSTDFAGLFLGLGIFIIVSGLAFASGTLRLALAQRSKQFGLMAAVGVPGERIRQYVGVEGFVLAVKGAFIGVAGGAGYAWAVVKLLNAGWSDAVGSTPVELYIGWQALAMGFGIGLFVSLLTVWLAVRSLSRRPVLELLQAKPTSPFLTSSNRQSKGLLLLSALVFVVAIAMSNGGQSAHFFIAGSLYLVLGLLILASGLGLATTPNRVNQPNLRQLAMKNLSARRGQAILVASLLACASFTLVAVAANARLMTPKELEKRTSGSGGFSLILTTHTGPPYDLNSKEGRQKLGLPDDPAMNGIKAVPFLMEEGDDASCLNMAKPQSPTVLGVLTPNELKGRFSVKGESLSDASDKPDKTIEAAADSETAEWILHTGLGKTLKLEKPNKAVTIKSLVKKSLFAREIIVGKSDFKQMFPGNDAPRYFLIETPNKEQAAKILKENLAEYGAKVERVDRLMADLMGVQNAYIKTFLALGGLGLALGMFGLVSALLRNIAERRKELALLSACGFSKAHIVKLLLMENAGLMVYGVGLGTLSALFAVIKIASETISGAWITLAIAIGATLLVGIAACTVATLAAVRKDLVKALRSE